MITLNGIKAVPSQTFNVTIPEGLVICNLYFRSAIGMWMLDVFFDEFEVYSIRVCNSPNLLNQFSEIIPFGIMVSVGDNLGYEPSLINDFSSERVILNVLDTTEMQQIEDTYSELRS